MLEDKCYICGGKAVYVIEWYGVNQFGENPEVIEERSVCGDFNHIVEASRHEFYGLPDGIVDYKTLDKEYFHLLKRVLEQNN